MKNTLVFLKDWITSCVVDPITMVNTEVEGLPEVRNEMEMVAYIDKILSKIFKPEVKA